MGPRTYVYRTARYNTRLLPNEKGFPLIVPFKLFCLGKCFRFLGKDKVFKIREEEGGDTEKNGFVIERWRLDRRS